MTIHLLKSTIIIRILDCYCICSFLFFGGEGGGELWAKTKSMCKQKKRKKENMYKASISRSNDTENYLPC